VWLVHAHSQVEEISRCMGATHQLHLIMHKQGARDCTWPGMDGEHQHSDQAHPLIDHMQHNTTLPYRMLDSTGVFIRIDSAELIRLLILRLKETPHSISRWLLKTPQLKYRNKYTSLFDKRLHGMGNLPRWFARSLDQDNAQHQ
jgi:hypothetical protein